MDNSDFNQKIAVRQKGLALLPNPSKIVDMYAGEGHISRSFWSKLNAELTCIEKEQWKVDKLDFDCVKICDNNKKYVDLASKADIVDLDAYGLVMKILRDILNANKKTQLILIPMINVDGVTLGNYRVSFSGDDLNRTYHDPKQNHPETKELKKLVESLSKEK